MIKILAPDMPSADRVYRYMDTAFRKNIFSNYGPLSQELESRFAEFLGVSSENVVTVANATLGIQGSIQVLTPSTWQVPNYSFPATGLAVLATHAPFRLCDVDENSRLTATTSLNESRLPVCPFGMRPRVELSESETWTVVDAAASLPNSENSLINLKDSTCVVFSLHATKILAAGEGGLVVFGDSRWAQEFRAWANFGFSGNRSSAIPGTNAKLSEFHAAVGLASLDEWEIKKVGWTARCGRASQYNAEFDISPGYFEDGSISPYWNVQLDSAKSASDLIEYMRVNGIETRQWWGVPLDAMPAFMDVEKEKNLKNSEMLAGRTVGLPMHSRLTEADLERIASHIWDFLSLRAN